MPTNFTPGAVVKITNLSKSSYFLYRHYTQYSPLIICPCHLKRDQLLIVEDMFDNSKVLLKVKNRPLLTVTYSYDLELVYEH